MYSVGTLRSHYSRYLLICLAQNTTTNTKCNEKITSLLPIQPKPTHGPNPCPSLPCHFILTMSHHYLVKLRNTKSAERFIQFILSSQLFLIFAESYSVFFSPFFSSLLKKFFSNLLAENLSHSHRFLSKFYIHL